PAFEWVHVQLHQQKGMISLSPPTICNSAVCTAIHAQKRHADQPIPDLTARTRATEDDYQH
ncbi:hypothetical protein NY820_06850, partial [Escherichia coli]|uniref:hypothetical protein n=1 Tax=Escherichia coli TaxID=562 RepID=UPI0022F00F7C